MATKKKSAKKAKPIKAKAAPKKSAPKTAKPAKKRTASPRSQVLPGMEQVRNRSLDHICEELSDVRREINELNGQEDSLASQAMKIMERDKVPAYRHHGIELGLQTGATKLRIRVLKDKTESSGAAKQDTGSGQDAGEIAEALTEPAVPHPAFDEE